ncbi:MAG: TetR/AcrR family transcriptional regulator [Mycolicibacterium sp.]|nr:TetR/AcrR family transcriptional regulator [Mycolicibacterium sp.]HNM94587.1 TetR/AcrR family transcriptional regulator [Mycobacterium sp.]
MAGDVVARQARAEMTRGKIIDAAVDLFEAVGYGDTDLTAIIKRAGVTKGAFYYHFEGKDQVADAIIDEGKVRLQQAFVNADRFSSSALQCLVVATFEVARLMRTDRLVGIGNLLAQSLSQIGDAGTRAYVDFTAVFIDHAKSAAAQGDLRTDVVPEEAGEAIWVAVLGCHLLSDAIGDDLFARLARAWRVLIVGVVAEGSVAFFEDFLVRTAAQYGPAPG